MPELAIAIEATDEATSSTASASSCVGVHADGGYAEIMRLHMNWPPPSALQGRAMAETFPLAKAYVASGRMMNNEARFRFVLVAGQREFVTSERL